MSWEAGSVQAVLFERQPMGLPDPLQPWRKLFTSNPQSFQQNPPGSPPAAQAEGVVGNLQVTLQHQPARLDLIVGPTPPSQPQPATIANINDVLQSLTAWVHKLIEDRSLVRLACVLNLVQYVDSDQEACDLVKGSAPLLSIPPTAHDLDFALNVRKSMNSVPSLEMNRLCRWNTGIEQIIQMGFRPDGISQRVPVYLKHTANFVIDVNSVPRRVALESEEANSVFKELAEEVLALKEGGFQELIRDA